MHFKRRELDGWNSALIPGNENLRAEFKSNSFVLFVQNLRDEQYIFELADLPGPIALKKKNSVSVRDGTVVVELQKSQKGAWKNFIAPGLLAAKETSLDARSNASDLSEGFFDDVDDEELRSEMDKLIFQALHS